MVGACALHDLMFRWVNASGPTLSGPTPPLARSGRHRRAASSLAAKQLNESHSFPSAHHLRHRFASRPLRSAQKAPNSTKGASRCAAPTPSPTASRASRVRFGPAWAFFFSKQDWNPQESKSQRGCNGIPKPGR